MSVELLQANKVVAHPLNSNIDQELITYKQSSVIVIEPDGWYSTFLVNEKTRVETVDIYTYQCQSCKNCMKCSHVEAVKDYVLQRMDIFAQCCELNREMIPVMKDKMDKLRQYTELYLHAKVLRFQAQEMRFVIRKLRNTVNDDARSIQ